MQDEKETPIQRLQRENKRLQDRTIRLDFENDQVFDFVSFPAFLRPKSKLGAEIANRDATLSKTEQRANDEAKRVKISFIIFYDFLNSKNLAWSRIRRPQTATSRASSRSRPDQKQSRTFEGGKHRTKRALEEVSFFFI